MQDHLERVILVDENDQVLLDGPKLETHEDGLLHRAFSVFVFNTAGELLIQKRPACKYHSAGKWANSCCGHPRPDEETQSAAERRLTEEIGLHVPLRYGFKSRYIAMLDNHMIENEIPYLYFGVSDALPVLNPDEVQDIAYVGLEELSQKITANPDSFSAWLIHYMDSHAKRLRSWRDRLLVAQP